MVLQDSVRKNNLIIVGENGYTYTNISCMCVFVCQCTVIARQLYLHVLYVYVNSGFCIQYDYLKEIVLYKRFSYGRK